MRHAKEEEMWPRLASAQQNQLGHGVCAYTRAHIHKRGNARTYYHALRKPRETQLFRTRTNHEALLRGAAAGGPVFTAHEMKPRQGTTHRQAGLYELPPRVKQQRRSHSSPLQTPTRTFHLFVCFCFSAARRTTSAHEEEEGTTRRKKGKN